MLAYYGTEISPNQTETAEGFLICRNVPIARTGEMVYLARELRLGGDPERLVMVHRAPEDVFDPAAMASFEGKPVTDGHPPENVGPENFSAYARGHVQNVRREGDYLLADLYINDASLASDVQNRVKREVSCGYLCIYTPDGDGYRQGRIRGNHVAVVPRGRAGHEVAIKDAAQEAEKGRKKMSDFWKSVLTAFGMAAKEASPEEMDQMVSTAAAALDAAAAEKKEEDPGKEDTPPAREKEETHPAQDKGCAAGEDGGKPAAASAMDAKLDRILSLIEQSGKASEKKLRDETALDSAVEALSAGDSTVVPAGNGMDAAARDAAVAMLKGIRPAVAAIRDAGERSRVVDALLESIKGPDMMAQVHSVVQANAQKAADAAGTTFETRCRESEAAYAARNPHKKKED